MCFDDSFFKGCVCRVSEGVKGDRPTRVALCKEI